MVDSVEEESEVFFFFEGDFGVFFEFVEVDDFGVDFVKDFAELYAIRELFDSFDIGLDRFRNYIGKLCDPCEELIP